MRNILLVFRRDYNEMKTTAAFRIMAGLAAVIGVAAAAAITITVRLQDWFGAAEAAPILDIITGLIVFFLPMVVLIAFIWAFAGTAVVKEKLNGNLDCLMATPMGPKTLLMGKTFAIFIPAYLISVAVLVFVFVVSNLAAFVPGWGTVSLPWPALFAGLVASPLMLLAVVMITLIITLVANPDMAPGPSLVIGFGLMLGLPFSMAAGGVDILSWSFVGWFMAGTGLIWLVTLWIMRYMTRQRIVLSEKGS